MPARQALAARAPFAAQPAGARGGCLFQCKQFYT